MTKKYIFFCYLFFVVTANADFQYDTKWFTVPLDHNNFLNKQSFEIKYLVNDDYWDRSGGPIFFLAGSEAPIGTGAPGFMSEIAPQFKAKIVVAEHRYYGDSIPMPKDGSPYDDDINIPMGYLSVNQALDDYANLLFSMEGGTKYPVIAFGGSYGGMLSAYMRMKYPHLVAGAIASSAPIIDNVPCNTYYKTITSSFALANANCSINIRNSWDVIMNFTKDANNYDWLTTNWKLCNPIEDEQDVDSVMNFLTSLYDQLAMYNFPYPGAYKAEPVRSVCQYLSELLTGKALLEAISNVLDEVIVDECVEYRTQYYAGDYGNDTSSQMWNYQCCTEMPQTQMQCSTGVDDMFRPSPFDQPAYSEQCYNEYGVYPSYNWAEVEFGDDRLQAASNIVFSNGLLDPWAGYGLLQIVSKTVKAVVMNDTAHAMDLNSSDAADPPSVRAVRQFHKRNIRKWIRNFQSAQTKNCSNSEYDVNFNGVSFF